MAGWFGRLTNQISQAFGQASLYDNRYLTAPSVLNNQLAIAQFQNMRIGSYQDMYRLLRYMYYNNSLYEQLSFAMYYAGLWHEGIKPLRNPTFRVVEFYVSKIWGGPLDEALPIDAPNGRIVDPIKQVWSWSNWSVKKQVASRTYAMLGDLYLKIAQSDDEKRVFIQRIEPDNVTAFDKDEQGRAAYVRIDVRCEPDEDEQGYAPGSVLLDTEIWNLERGDMRVWRHDLGMVPESELGNPDQITTLAELQIDYLPFVHAPFRDVGEERGMAAITPALDKIDEANRMITRLHQQLFRNNTNTWALSANMTSPDGRPMPAPKVDTGSADGTIQIGDDKVFRLPGMSRLESLVPNINYAAGLDILRDHITEIERDLPEMAYYSISDLARNMSGIALRYMLADAIDRVTEVRGNAYAALTEADSMALDIAQKAGIEGFGPDTIGTRDNGDFEHTFDAPPVIPLSPLEEAQADQARGAAAVAFGQAGFPFEEVAKRAGYTDEEIQQMNGLRANAAAASGGALLDALNGKVTP